MELHSETFNPADFARRGLTLTPAAAAHIHELVAKKPEILGVRLGVKQTGCAGFGYVLDTVTEPEKDDRVRDRRRKIVRRAAGHALYRWHRSGLRPRRLKSVIQIS